MISPRVLFSTIGLGALGLTSAAFAADPIVDTIAYYPYSISGYVELRIGFDLGNASGTYNDGAPQSWDETWHGMVFGGAARAATPLTSDLTVQGDVWLNGWGWESDISDTGHLPTDFTATGSSMEGGVAGHLSWRPDSSTLIGVLASLGGDNWSFDGNEYDGLYGTVGLEGAIGDEMWRAYGQVGVTAALGGDAGDDGAVDIYARGVVAYYLDPNLSVSANLGADAFSNDSNGGTTETGITWGARLEYKPADMPFSGFLAYQGWAWSGEDNFPSDWSGTEHALLVGMRIPFGADGATTLRAMDDEVGLYDMNAIYGESFVR